MSTTFIAQGDYPMPAFPRIKRIALVGVIILAHAALVYGLQSGLARPALQGAFPKEVFATFITPEPAAKLPEPQPAAPKTVPLVKKSATPPPPVPAINTMPSTQAMTAVPTVPTAPASEVAAPEVAAVSTPAPAAPALPKTITSGIEYLQAPQPEYPPISKRMGEQGQIMLRILVNEKGYPERVEVQKSSGSARLDDAARRAALHAVFKPFVEDGKAVMAYALVPIRFQLDN